LFVLYLVLLLSGTFILSFAEDLPVLPVMFECASALGTVGLTTGITPGLSALSRIVLICFMYIGRVGGLTLTYAMVSLTKKETSKMPVEKLTVG
jgi:trk system potassium uptake protein TrkH